MCGDCKYFNPCMNIPAGLEPYGRCQNPYGAFKGQIKYDYSSACRDYDRSY